MLQKMKNIGMIFLKRIVTCINQNAMNLKKSYIMWGQYKII